MAVDQNSKICYPSLVRDIFYAHNLFRKSVRDFRRLDPQLSALQGQKYVYRSALETQIPLQEPGIYILTGGRQVGKTTFLKLIIDRLLEMGTAPGKIFYMACDTIEDFRELLWEIESFAKEGEGKEHFYLFLDEVTYVHEWERAIKHLADTGFFRQGSVLITGSDSFILKEAMMKFPGRRGGSSQTDFHLFPLSFHEYTLLRAPLLGQELAEFRKIFQNSWSFPWADFSSSTLSLLRRYFEDYLLTGGFILAINHYAAGQKISAAVYKTYVQWILGDLFKRGKQETTIRELFGAIAERLASQVTWHNLCATLSIGHHQTVADYLEILSRMDVLFIQPALREDRFRPAPKKAKKLHFRDPFIFHALNSWVREEQDGWELAQKSVSDTSAIKRSLVEGCLSALCSRQWNTCYIKAQGEVDIALLRDKAFLPIEVKWASSVSLNEIKQLSKYENGILACRTSKPGKIGNATMIPIELLALLVA